MRPAGCLPRCGPAALLKAPQHQVDEAVEQAAHVVRPGARLRMALEAERRLVGARDALQRAVEQRAMRGLQRSTAASLSSTAKPWFWLVMNTRPVSRSCTGWFAPWWPNFIFMVLRAAGEAQQLVAEADAERRHVRVHERADRLDGVVARLRIARTVRQEHAIGLERQHFFGRGLRRHHGHAAAAVGEHAQDVALRRRSRRRPRAGAGARASPGRFSGCQMLPSFHW